MPTIKYLTVLCMSGFFLAACGQSQVPAVESVGTEGTESLPVPKYSAEVFFETTSYGLVGSAAHAFSVDGQSLLISSDETGVFNAYSLPLDGTVATPLTSSDDNAIFAVSWFPDDARILYTFDSGGDELIHVVVREENGTSRDLTPGDALKARFFRLEL